MRTIINLGIIILIVVLAGVWFSWPEHEKITKAEIKEKVGQLSEDIIQNVSKGIAEIQKNASKEKSGVVDYVKEKGAKGDVKKSISKYQKKNEPKKKREYFPTKTHLPEMHSTDIVKNTDNQLVDGSGGEFDEAVDVEPSQEQLQAIENRLNRKIDEISSIIAEFGRE